MSKIREGRNVGSKPGNARELGTCNACNDQIGASGTKAGAVVTEVYLRPDSGGGLTFRLCDRCGLSVVRQLVAHYKALRVLRRVRPVPGVGTGSRKLSCHPRA